MSEVYFDAEGCQTSKQCHPGKNEIRLLCLEWKNYSTFFCCIKHVYASAEIWCLSMKPFVHVKR